MSPLEKINAQRIPFAELLGITRPTLYDLMERMSIRPADE